MPPANAGFQLAPEARLERGDRRENSGELAVDLYNRHLGDAVAVQKMLLGFGSADENYLGMCR